MWGTRVVIPKVHQQKVQKELHGGHLGVVKMKALARSHVWYPHIDKDIEGAAQHCGRCQILYTYGNVLMVRGGGFIWVIVNAYSKWRLWQWMKPPKTGQWMNCMLS